MEKKFEDQNSWEMDKVMYLKFKKNRLLFLIAFLKKDHIANRKFLSEKTLILDFVLDLILDLCSERFDSRFDSE